MIREWVMLKAAGVPVSFADVVGMVLRRSLSPGLVHALIAGHKAGLEVPRMALEAHALAGGRPEQIVKAALVLKGVGEPPDYPRLAAIDLQRPDLLDLMQTYVRVREAYPTFGFDEFSQRLLDGEDVIGLAASGSLAPLSLSGGWRVRIERGPLSPDALRDLLDRTSSDEGVTVCRPGSAEWEPVRNVREM